MNTDYLKLESEGTKEMSREKIGAPITAYWKIRTLKEGEAQISMKCYRPWEGPEKASEQFTIKVTISKEGE